MTFPLHPAALVFSGSIMYAIEKAGKTTEDLFTFAKANGYEVESNFSGYWFTGECVNAFLAD